MRILLLTQWFQPEGFFKGLPFAEALRDKGHDVQVLTGFPNYPSGRLYPGFRIRWYQREVMNGITVHRVPLFPSHDRSAFRRIMNYLSFALSALVIGPWVVRKPEIVYVYNLITLGPAAFLIRRLCGARVMIDVQDLWPESVAGSGMLKNGAALRLLKGVCDCVYRKADGLAVLSPGFRRQLSSRGIPPERIEVIYNWCNEAALAPMRCDGAVESRNSPRDKFNVLFAGSMGIFQGLDTLLECARICADELPGVQFTLIGGGVDRDRLRERAAAMSLNNVVFLPPRPAEIMDEVFAQADALLVHLKDDPLFRITIPSKTQAYLYVGKPIIMAMRGDAREIILNAGAGIVCDPDNPKELMRSIEELCRVPEAKRRDMGASGRQYYYKHMSFNLGVERFEAAMKDLLSIGMKPEC